MQRDDLLPVPLTGESALRCVFVNEAPETQYTDLLELVVVDHPAGTRAVATVEQTPMLVRDARPPVEATDVAGAIVTDALAREDGTVWQTDWNRLIQDATAPTTETITATFDRPANAGAPVLELVLSNTPWLEFTLSRFFALTGNDFESTMTQWNSAGAGPWVHQWLDREGVSLSVEQRRHGRWEPVAVVPPVGPVALRRVAIPLNATDDGTVEVRVNGGTGFWQIDQMALSTRAADEARVQRIAPVRAASPDGTDELALVESRDGKVQVLEHPGDRLEFDFEIPAASAGTERSAFLFANGYYNVHAPAAPDTTSSVAAVVQQPGGLAALGIDTYRHYDAISRATPRRDKAVVEVRR